MSALPRPSTLLPPHHGPHQDIMRKRCARIPGGFLVLALGGRELEAQKLWSFPRSGPEHPSPQAHTHRRCQEPSAPKAPGLWQSAGVDWGVESLVDASALRPTIRARSLGARGRRRSCVTPPPQSPSAVEGVPHPLALEHSAAGEKAEKSAPDRAFQPHTESGRRGCCRQIRGSKRTFLHPPFSPWRQVPPPVFLAPCINQGCAAPSGLARRGAKNWRRESGKYVWWLRNAHPQ